MAANLHQVSDSSSSDSDSDETEEESSASEVEDDDVADPNAELQQLQLQMQQMQRLQGLSGGGQPPWGQARRGLPPGQAARLQARQLAALNLLDGKKGRKEKKSKRKRASKLEFKRVDQLWDSTIHNYKLTDTAQDEESSEYDQYLFNVRRTFDWEGKYKVSNLQDCNAQSERSPSSSKPG